MNHQWLAHISRPHYINVRWKMEDITKEKWFTVKQAVAEAGVSNFTICSAIREGKLVAKQIPDSSRYGYHYLISESALLAWVDDRKTVKAHAVATAKTASEMNAADIAEWITLKIKKAYDEGYRDGKRDGKREIMEAIKGVK